jgi:hypothetical protein
VHYRDPGCAGRLYNASRVGEHVRFFHDRSDSVMQSATLGSEVALIFDEYNGGAPETVAVAWVPVPRPGPLVRGELFIAYDFKSGVVQRLDLNWSSSSRCGHPGRLGIIIRTLLDPLERVGVGNRRRVRHVHAKTVDLGERVFLDGPPWSCIPGEEHQGSRPRGCAHLSGQRRSLVALHVAGESGTRNERARP